MPKKVEKKFDPFSNIAKDIIEFEINHPATGEGTGMFIKMHSKCSDACRVLENKQAERYKNSVKLSKTGKVITKDYDPEEVFIQEREDIASLIIDWSGSDTPYSPEKAKELMTAKNMQPIAIQILEAFGDDANLY